MNHYQPTLWGDPPPATGDARDAWAARVNAIAAVDAGAHPAWKTAARNAVRYCAVALPTFTADDVLDVLTAMGAPPTPTPSALGPVFLAAANAGEIHKTGELRPTRFARRHRDLTVWAGRAAQ